MPSVKLSAIISADAREFYRTVGKVGPEAAKMLRNVAAGGAAVATAVTAAWIAAIGKTVAYGSAVQDIIDRTGLGSAVIQKLGYVAMQTGGDMQAILPAMKALANALQSAGQGGKTQQRAFRDLGLSWKELAASSPDQQIEAVLLAIAKVGDPTKRAALAVDILGRSGQALIPVAAAYRELGAEAEALGLLLKPEQIAAADRLGDSLALLQRKFGAVSMGAVGPDLSRLADVIDQITKDPAVWAAVEGGVRTAASALADLAGSMGAVLKDPETIRQIGSMAQGLGDGFKLAADGAGALLTHVTALLKFFNDNREGLAGLFGAVAGTETAERRLAGMNQLSPEEQTASAVRLRDRGVTVSKLAPTDYQQALRTEAIRGRAMAETGTTQGPELIEVMNRIAKTLDQRMPEAAQ